MTITLSLEASRIAFGPAAHGEILARNAHICRDYARSLVWSSTPRALLLRVWRYLIPSAPSMCLPRQLERLTRRNLRGVGDRMRQRAWITVGRSSSQVFEAQKSCVPSRLSGHDRSLQRNVSATTRQARGTRLETGPRSAAYAGALCRVGGASHTHVHGGEEGRARPCSVTSDPSGTNPECG